MNFVRSSQTYQSTDVSHVEDLRFRDRQRFGESFRGHGLQQSNFSSQHFRGPRDRFGPQGSRSSFTRPSDRFYNSDSFSQQQEFGSSQRFSRPLEGNQQSFNASTPRSSGMSEQRFGGQAFQQNSAYYRGFVKPQHQKDHFEGGDGRDLSVTNHAQSPVNKLTWTSPMRHPYSSPRFPGNSAARTSGRFATSIEGGGPLRAGGRGFCHGSSGPRFGAGRGSVSKTTTDNFSSIEAATAAAARATKEAINPNAKCVVLAADNFLLVKFKNLTEQIKKLKSKRPNAIDTIHSAANIAHVNIQSEIESGPIVRGTGTFFCLVQFEGVNVAVCTGLNKRSAKNEAFDIALQKLMKPYQRIVLIDGSTKEFQASDYEFPCEEPKQTVIKPISAVVANISGESSDGMANAIQKESNVEALVDIKKKNYVAKDLSDLVLVEPQEHNSNVNGASILRRSADFSKMLLEYDFAAYGVSGSVRCVLKVEGQALADVVAYSKMAAKVEASQKAVDILREQCWTILTKQVHDSNAPEITKDEMFADLASCISTNAASMSTPIADGNLGKKLLQKMGWTGGGIGKDGMGIEEPVTMKKVINREGLGLDQKRGITEDFRNRITELLENYASSERQDDLIFSPHFHKDERIIIHNECRRLNLKSKSSGHGSARYLIVRRKRSAFQLLDHVMKCGGETARYKVVPPGQRKYSWRPTGYSGAGCDIGAQKAQSNVINKREAAHMNAVQSVPRLMDLNFSPPESMNQSFTVLQGDTFTAGMLEKVSPGLAGQSLCPGGM